MEAVGEVEVEIKAKHLWIAIQTAIFPNCHHSLESEKLSNELQFALLPTNCRLDLKWGVYFSVTKNLQ